MCVRVGAEESGQRFPARKTQNESTEISEKAAGKVS